MSTTGSDEAIKHIESVEFSVFMNVASSLTTYVNGLQADPSVQLLFKAIASDAGKRLISERLTTLAHAESDPAYENPNDVALSVYLLLFNWSDRGSGASVARMVSQVERCWWAARLARSILENNEASIRVLKGTGKAEPRKVVLDRRRLFWDTNPTSPVIRGSVTPGGVSETTFPIDFRDNQTSPSEHRSTQGNWKERKPHDSTLVHHIVFKDSK
jgi:hypothetical protein